MNYDLSIPGFMEESELRWLFDTASQMTSVVEIGCYQGRSTFALMQGCRGVVYAVDPWLDIMSNRANNLALFVRNIQSRVSRIGNPWPVNLRIVPMTSQEAAPMLPDVDMVFVDGDHLLPAVRRDIEIWTPKARRLICGHDYGNKDWPAVEQAVKERFGTGFTVPVGLIWAVNVNVAG
jgi:hypothetical protein